MDIKFIKTQDKLPSESKNYLCIVDSNGMKSFFHLHYSAQYKAFNCHDFDKERTVKKNKIDVVAWADITADQAYESI